MSGQDLMGVFRKLQTPADPHPGYTLLGSAESGENISFEGLLICVCEDKIDFVLSHIYSINSLIDEKSKLVIWAQIKEYLINNNKILHKNNFGYKENSWNELMYASYCNQIKIVNLLLDRGEDPSFGTNRNTPLGLAADVGNQDICIKLLSKGANLMDINNEGSTALSAYCSLSIRNLITFDYAVFCRNEMCAVWRSGPHPSQVKRRDDNWARCWPFMNVLYSGLFLLLAHRSKELASSALPHDVSIPPIDISTPEKRSAFLKTLVFSNKGLVRLICSF